MTGNIVRLIGEKGFGFIRSQEVEYFFHRSAFNGQWEDLLFDYGKASTPISVSFDLERSAKGPRATNVSVIKPNAA
jgi:cold shock CspA family protein